MLMQNENKFKCPCHGSQYNNEGKVVRGPAPLVRPPNHAARYNRSCTGGGFKHVYPTLVSLLQLHGDMWGSTARAATQGSAPARKEAPARNSIE